jgi:hypothetical protein
MVHSPNDDFLLAFALFASRIEEFTFCPWWNCAVAVGHVSSKEEGSKGRQFAPLMVFVVRPVCRSDFTLKENLL